MENVKTAVKHAQDILDQSSALTAAIAGGTPTKKLTAGLRKSLNDLKKIVTPAKEELLAHDKAGK